MHLEQMILELFRALKSLKQDALCERDDIKRLLDDPRNRRIELVDGTGFLIDSKHFYSGVTKVIPALWHGPESDDVVHATQKRRSIYSHPNLLFPQGTSSDDDNNKPIVENLYRPRAMVSTKHESCKLSSMKHGKIVHRELEQFVDSYVHGESDALLEKRLPRPDPCTVALVHSIYMLQLQPIAAEFKIWDDDLQIATAIDLLAVLPDGRLAVFEVKNGYEYQVYDELDDDPKLAAPFDDTVDCPKSRHLLQLLMTMMILKRKYGVVCDRYIVLRRQAGMKCVTGVDMDMTWAHAKEPLLYQYCLDRRLQQDAYHKQQQQTSSYIKSTSLNSTQNNVSTTGWGGGGGGGFIIV